MIATEKDNCPRCGGTGKVPDLIMNGADINCLVCNKHGEKDGGE